MSLARRLHGRFVAKGTAAPAPLLTARPEASRAAALIGSLGGKATARKMRGRTRLVADILREHCGLAPVKWPAL